MITRFLTSEDGASMTEYALIATLIAMVALVAVTAFGGQVYDLFDQPELLSALGN
jgi:Flp pilus assembly pilin Flp